MGETSSEKLHGRFVNCGGSGGGVASAGVVKSNISVISSCEASRLVSGARLKRVSTNFSIEVFSRGTCETYPGFAHGDTTASGTQNPERVKSPGAAPGSSEVIGGMLSGATTVIGFT